VKTGIQFLEADLTSLDSRLRGMTTFYGFVKLDGRCFKYFLVMLKYKTID
jgi:hypothetical protein